VFDVPRDDLLPRPHGGRFVIGGRNIDEHEWLPPHPALLRERTMERSAHPKEVFAALDGWGAAIANVFDSIPHDTPDDVLVLGRRDDRWVLVGGELCFPNRWVLAEKLGQSVLDIHGPVPNYANQVGAGVDSLLDRLTDGRIVERANWSISDAGVFFEPQTPPPVPNIDPADLFLRVERQTLRQMGDVVVFTIRTFMEPMHRFVTRPVNQREDFAQVLRETPDEVRAYKSIDTYVEPLISFLASPA
jgi:hypothetical protein